MTACNFDIRFTVGALQWHSQIRNSFKGIMTKLNVQVYEKDNNNFAEYAHMESTNTYGCKIVGYGCLKADASCAQAKTKTLSSS